MRLALLTLAALLVASSVDAQSPAPLVDGYQHLYGGQPEQASAHFHRLRAGDPRALAPWFGWLFSTMARLEYEEALATDFEQSIDAFIDQAAARHARSPQDAEALFYLAQGYLLRSTYRLSHDKGLWGAARDAAKSKGFSDEYLTRHPEHGDAYLTPGLYNYYVDIAPTFVKVLRTILFLPSGNRAQGLQQLERAASQGELFAPFAQAAIADIYSTFESRLRDAIPIAERYVQRYPQNAEVRLDLAAMHMHPVVESFDRAEQEFQRVRSLASGPSRREIAHRNSAVLGLAALRRTEWRLAEAIGLLDDAIAQAPREPRWIMPNLLLRRSNYRMLLNEVAGVDDARRVLANPDHKTWHKAAQQLLAGYESRRRNREGEIYAALVPGNRLVAENRFDEARTFYEDKGRQHPGDWQVAYRLAVLEFARGRYDIAAEQLQRIAGATAAMPDWLKAAALLHLAYTHDLAGRRDQALKLYRRIVDKYEDDGSAGAARTGLLSPYRR